MATDIAETSSEYGDIILTQFGRGLGKGLGMQLNADSKWVRLTRDDVGWLITELTKWQNGLPEENDGR